MIRENPAGVRLNSAYSQEGTRKLTRQVFPQVDPKDLPQSGDMPGSGAPDHGGDPRGVFSNVRVWPSERRIAY